MVGEMIHGPLPSSRPDDLSSSTPSMDSLSTRRQLLKDSATLAVIGLSSSGFGTIFVYKSRSDIEKAESKIERLTPSYKYSPHSDYQREIELEDLQNAKDTKRGGLTLTGFGFLALSASAALRFIERKKRTKESQIKDNLQIFPK